MNKRILDISNDRDLDRYTPEDKRPIPFRNMIYIGDGYTDVPCVKLVMVNGGYSVAVYKKGEKEIVNNLLRDNRVDFLATADYSKNSELEKLICDMIIKIKMVDSLRKKSKIQIEEIRKYSPIES